jgi:hypothetical protein
MSARAAARLAWSLAGLCVALFAASVVLWVLARSARVPEGWDANITVASMLGQLSFLAYPLVGALIASRRPRNPIGWLLLMVGLLWMLLGASAYYCIYGVAQPGSVPFTVVWAGMTNWLWVPGVGLLGTYVFLLFPDGRLPSRGWRPLAWLSGVVIAMLSVGVVLSPGPLLNVGPIQNPFGLEEHPWVSTAWLVVLPLLPLCVLASALSLVLRYRRSGGEERQQIRWIAFAASVLGVLFVSGFVYPPEAWFADLLAYVRLGSFTLIPIAIGFAVLKYRLYEIDLLINRALVYGSLTAMLAGVYLCAVVVLQYLFRALSGQESQLAVVASTLAIAALFNPLRRRVQMFVDRRFYRSKYDARKTLEEFGARLRDETDLEQLNAELISVVRDTVQPEHASLWLRGSPGTGEPGPG